MVYERHSVQISPDAALMRYFRVKLSPPFKTDKGSQAERPLLPKLMLVNQCFIKTNDPESRLQRIGCCIYCGAIEFQPQPGSSLSEEHIIARGLGGTLILEEASCLKCAKHTGERIEQLVLGGGLLAPRRQLKIRGRKRKRNDEVLNLVSVVNGKDVKIDLPLGEHPTVLFIASFRPPRLIGGQGGIGGGFVHTFNAPEAAIRRGAEAIASHGFDTVVFSQMLAKIAHGYAIAKIGARSFVPYLVPFILRKFERADHYPACYDLVGGNPDLFAPSEPEELHQLGHEIVGHGNKRVIVVGIRLFANLGAPLFWVVAGEIL